jgi:hypothetical protein
MPRLLPAVPLVLVALASGCTANPSSSNGFEGEEKNVAEVVDKLGTAGRTGDAGELCDNVFSKRLREAIAESGSTCEQELDKAIKDADDFDLEVDDVTIDGDRATAKVTGKADGKDQVRDFTFTREGKTWRATDLGS